MKHLLLLIMLLFTQLFHAQNIEKFADSKTVIRNGKYKLAVTQTNHGNSAGVVFLLSEKLGKKWILRQKEHFTKDNFYLAVTTDEDLNNDGYKDVKFSYARAARGSNEVTLLYIFSLKTKKLERISNSPDFPNLHYNPRRKCLMSYMFYGGTGSLFLKIKNKKLIEFAHVENMGETMLIYKIINGKKTHIHTKKAAYKGIELFDDYDPIHELK